MTEQERPDGGSGKDLFTRLADAGEDAIQRLAEMPGGRRFAEALNSMRLRVDDLQRRVRGIDELEQRVADLERKMAAFEMEQSRASTAGAASSTAPTTTE